MEDFNFKKKFGQNFIKNKNIIDRIVSSVNIDKDSLVLEVGPGKGVLTRELSKKAGSVLCYEIDNDLKEYLTDEFNNTNVDIIFDDFLNRDINDDIKNYKYKKLYFVSNVPYYITTPILMKLIDSSLDIEQITIMVQEEVGDRFSATPGNKSYGSITVFLNYFYNIRKEFKVSRNEFVPVPNVDSIVISFTKKDELIPLKNKDTFFKLIKDSFQFKRKTIRNNLKNYDLDKISNVLEKNNFSLTTRAEEIPVEVFVEMANEIEK